MVYPNGREEALSLPGGLVQEGKIQRSALCPATKPITANLKPPVSVLESYSAYYSVRNCCEESKITNKPSGTCSENTKILDTPLW